MKRAVMVLAFAALATPASAQFVNVGIQGVFADYRELVWPCRTTGAAWAGSPK